MVSCWLNMNQASSMHNSMSQGIKLVIWFSLVVVKLLIEDV